MLKQKTSWLCQILPQLITNTEAHFMNVFKTVNGDYAPTDNHNDLPTTFQNSQLGNDKEEEQKANNMTHQTTNLHIHITA